MNVLRHFTCLLFVPLALASAGGGDGTSLPWTSPGDVLHPGSPSSGLVWHLGLDAGLTYSMFGHGPATYLSPNPYWSTSLAAPYTLYPFDTPVNDGKGLGFAIGAAVDLSFSRMFGIVGKVNYHTRVGAFDNTIDTKTIHPQTQTGLTTVFENKVDWTFSYIGIDLLARIQLIEQKLYVLVGPSFSNLLKNKATLAQTIVQPNDIYYTEEVFQTSPVERKLRSLSTEGEVAGFDKWRTDIKIGLGWWIPLKEDLFLTPEITVAIPVSKMVAGVSSTVTPATPIVAAPVADSSPFLRSPSNWNMTTIFATVGLRWRLH